MKGHIKIWFLFLGLLLSSPILFAQSVGGTTTGTIGYCDTLNSGFIALTGQTGSILYWQKSTNNGGTWSILSNSTSSQSYNNVKVTTLFRAVVQNGAFPADTSSTSTITIFPKTKAGVINGAKTYCLNSGSGNLIITGNQGGVLNWESSANNGASWISIPNTTTSLTYNNITINTLYRALLQNNAVCPIDTTPKIQITINSSSVAGTLTKTDTVCNGQNNDTLFVTAGSGNVVSWVSSVNNGSTWDSIGNNLNYYIYNNITTTTLYKAVVKNGVCPNDSTNSIKLIIVNPALANAGPDKKITRFDITSLSGTGNGIISWDPPTGLSSTTVLNPSASPLVSTTYTLTLLDSHHCISEDSVLVDVYVPIPTAITPNDDGVNDAFEVDKVENYNNSTFRVFDRWGIIVFETKAYKNDWKGTSKHGAPLPDDTYFFTLDFGNVKKESISGPILIKR